MHGGPCTCGRGNSTSTIRSMSICRYSVHPCACAQTSHLCAPEGEAFKTRPQGRGACSRCDFQAGTLFFVHESGSAVFSMSAQLAGVCAMSAMKAWRSHSTGNRFTWRLFAHPSRVCRVLLACRGLDRQYADCRGAAIPVFSGRVLAYSKALEPAVSPAWWAGMRWSRSLKECRRARQSWLQRHRSRHPGAVHPGRTRLADAWKSAGAATWIGRDALAVRRHAASPRKSTHRYGHAMFPRFHEVLRSGSILA